MGLSGIDRAVDQVLDECVELDPTNAGVARRASDGRSVWIEPVAAHVTSRSILAQEDAIITWTLDAQLDAPRPSVTINPVGLDVLQADAAATVAGRDRLAVIADPSRRCRALGRHPPRRTPPPPTHRRPRTDRHGDRTLSTESETPLGVHNQTVMSRVQR